MNEKEKSVVSLMIRIYCQAKHKQHTLCESCRQLENYAYIRLERCPFKEKKPACKQCIIHCYKPVYKNKIRKVMRFSGPRMIFYHPLEAFRHFFKK